MDPHPTRRQRTLVRLLGEAQRCWLSCRRPMKHGCHAASAPLPLELLLLPLLVRRWLSQVLVLRLTLLMLLMLHHRLAPCAA